MKKCSIILISLLATQPVAAVDFSSLFKQVFNYFPSMKASTQTVQNTWSSLTPAQQGVVLTATTAAACGITYAAWPRSKKAAFRAADRYAAQVRKDIDEDRFKLKEGEYLKLAGSFKYGPLWSNKKFNVYGTLSSANIFRPESPSCPQVTISDPNYNMHAILHYLKQNSGWVQAKPPACWDSTLPLDESIPLLD
jgi:hypothetical protein